MKMYRLLSVKCANTPKIGRLPPAGGLNLCGRNNTMQNQLCHHILERQMPVAGLLLAPRAQASTTTTQQNELEAKLRKKRTRKPYFLKFVDLLEVTDTNASERKSRVRRLKSKKLSEFIQITKQQILEKRAKEEQTLENKRSKAEKRVKEKKRSKSEDETRKLSQQQPVEYQKFNFDLLDNSILEAGGIYDDKPLIFFGKDEYTKRVVSNPEEVQNILKSFHNFREIIENMESDIIENANYNLEDVAPHESVEVINEIDSLESVGPFLTQNFDDLTPAIPTTEPVNKIKLTTKNKRFKSKMYNNEQMERLARQRALRLNLSTYLNICTATGLLNRALSTMLTYRSRAKKAKHRNDDLITIDLYNILLHGYAGQGNFDRFKNVFALINADGLSLNEQTYAAIFEIFGRMQPTNENKEELRKYITKAEQQGFTLHQIMDRSKFVSDQRDIALDAIQRLHPDFKPIYTPPNLIYNNVLLNDLNTVHEFENDAKPSAIMNSKRGYSKSWLETMAREQLKIELAGCITIKSIEKFPEYENSEIYREKLKGVEQLWRNQIAAAIVRDLNTLRAQIRYKPSGYMSYYTFLQSLDTAQFSDILIQEIYKLAEGSETFSPTVGFLFKELGKKVQQVYQIEQKKRNGSLEKIGQIYSSYCDLWASGAANENTRQMWQRLVHEERHSGPSMDINELCWPTNVLIGVGRFLYNILMRDIKIDGQVMRQKSKTKTQNMLPAFYTLFRSHGRLVKEEVKPHPVLARLLRAARKKTLTFDSNLVPMLCPPQPWSTPHNGGYLLNKSELLRLPHQAVQQWERINSTNPQNLYPALDSLNQLASIPWRVNTQLLDVINEVFQNGGNAKLDVPQPASSLPPLENLSDKDADLSKAERAKKFKKKLGHRRKQAEMFSLWCDTLYRLSLANHFRDKVFWLPHNMDFRGRVYPVPPHLNHLGSDLARSLLVFDQAQPLGEDGFSWLKLHCINLTSFKKNDSVRERLLYAEAVMPEILDSADNPLTGRMWWAKSDKPWQTLASCMEIAKVYRSPNPAAYMSRFPIHQDGSCNGLQHYAALGRDKAGAMSVNLSPTPVPQDVYSAVGELVEKARKVDAANGLHVAQALEGFVRRKVIKQTVMTTVYGVTRYGARLQIARQLKDIEDFPQDWVWPASTYLTTKTFESLREMFTSAREIQDWFTECARLIAGTCGKNVEWVTPLGLPVVQPYNNHDYPQNARSNSTRVPESLAADMYERPNVLKQKNAFPPNFIHSLDSSHMMLTSLHCEHKGLTFISVHDCFWTHASTVPDLNKICREQFVALHSQPILEELSDFMRETYGYKDTGFKNDGSVEDHAKRRLNQVLGKLPQKGDFDLNDVLKSVYFFS